MRVIFAVCENPIQPKESTRLHFITEDSITINKFIEDNLQPLARVATVIHGYNGRDVTSSEIENAYILPSEWDNELQDGDYIILTPVLGFADWAIYLIVSLVSLLAGVLIFSLMSGETGNGTSSNSVYSLSSLKNEQRKGKCVKYCCGRLNRVPDYIAKPYGIYINNEQWLYASFCLGIGKFDVEETRFEDTPTSNYSNVSIAKVEPYGFAASVFSYNNVWTNSEVDSIELYASNEKDWHDESGWNGYPTDGWFGFYRANKITTSASVFYLDFAFPAGLGHTKKNGDAQNYTVSWEIQGRRAYISGGSVLYSSTYTWSYSMTDNGTTPLRFTKTINVPQSGCWEFRVRRTSIRNALHSARGNRTMEILQWTSLRAVLPSISSYDANVTTYQLKAKARNGLSNAASQRFRVLCTAKKPIYNPETDTWSDPVATRNPIWAFCDVVRNKYFGNISDKYLNMEVLYPMATWCDSNGIYFDYDFDEQESISEQLGVIARVLRSKLDLSGNKISLIRDEKASIPLRVYTKENIVNGSFKIAYTAPAIDDHDGANAEYTDPETWDTETVLTTLSGEDGSNPETVTIPGVISRTQAWRIAYNERYNTKNRLEAFSFTTDKYASVHKIFDLVYVNHPLIRHGVSARIVSIVGNTIVLDQNVKLNTSGSYVNNLVIFDPITQVQRSVHVVAYADAESGDYHTLISATTPDASDMVFSDPQALPICVVGLGSNFSIPCKISKVSPKGDTCDLEVYPYDEDSYWADDQTPESEIPITNPDYPVTPPTNITAEYVADGVDVPTDILISWTPVTGFTEYSVDYSTDGNTWTNITTTTYSSVLLGFYAPGPFYARVGIVYNELVWIYGYSDIENMPEDIYEYIHISSDGYLEITADGYLPIH